jgi:hypothetical protein
MALFLAAIVRILLSIVVWAGDRSLTSTVRKQYIINLDKLLYFCHSNKNIASLV